MYVSHCVASTVSPTSSLLATPTIASSVSSTVSSVSSTVSSMSSSVSSAVSSVSSSVPSNQPSVSSMAPPSLVISIPNVGVTSTYDVPLPHTSGPIGRKKITCFV